MITQNNSSDKKITRYKFKCNKNVTYPDGFIQPSIDAAIVSGANLEGVVGGVKHPPKVHIFSRQKLPGRWPLFCVFLLVEIYFLVCDRQNWK